MPPDIEDLPRLSDNAVMNNSPFSWFTKGIAYSNNNGVPPSLPMIGDVNNSIRTMDANNIVQYQLHMLQETQQYYSSTLSREAVDFLVSLAVVTEGQVREKYRLGSIDVDLEHVTEEGDWATEIICNRGWNELSQIAIEEMFSSAPHAAEVFKSSNNTSSGGATVGASASDHTEDASIAGSMGHQHSHPWSAPPLYSPTRDRPVVYCLNGYYSYSTTCKSLYPEREATPIAVAEDSSVDRYFLGNDSTPVGLSPLSEIEEEAPPPTKSVMYTTVCMWIAHWQMLAKFEPKLVQVCGLNDFGIFAILCHMYKHLHRCCCTS